MKLAIVVILTSLTSLFAACGGNDPDCQGDHCVCPATDTCVHDCSTGGNTCEVQCAPGQACDVGCAPGEECNVECSGTSSCTVDCAGTDCDVTCPASGCTVSNCDAQLCDVTCGNLALPTRNGTTATCP